MDAFFNWTEMGDFYGTFEVDDTVNELLIEEIKERPSLYYVDSYTKSDEKQWDEIQGCTGIQS